MAAFAQHFLIAGLDTEVGLELEESEPDPSGATSSDFNPLERAYKGKILRMYPDAGSWSNFNPDGIYRLILPQGLRFCTDRELTRYSPRSHSFVVTKEDGERVYGVSLIFYEEVQDTNICHAIHTLQKMYSTESEGGTLKKTDRLRPRSAKSPGERSRSLPRHYQQVKLSTSSLDLSSATYDYRKDRLFVTKAIAVVCSVPLVQCASQVLKSIHEYSMAPNYDQEILEEVIYNFLYVVPLPSPGRSVAFHFLEDHVLLSMPKVPLELPLFDYNLLDFFDILGVENAIKLFICTLLENQVLVYSSDFEKLMLVCESITSLMYPFAWQHVYVPILPPNMENFLDAPVPYIMGLLRRTHDLELSKKGSVCIVDIDGGELDLPEELPDFPNEKELTNELRDNIVRFGGSYGANLLKEHAIETRDMLELSASQEQNSNSMSNSILDNSDTMEELNKIISKFESLSAKPSSCPSQIEESDPLRAQHRLNNAIREVFLNRFVHMFHSFEHFLIVPQPEEDLALTPHSQEHHHNFDKISFLSDQKKSHLPFLSSFLETQTFSSFIDEYIAILEDESLHFTPFTLRLKDLKEKYGESLVRTPTYEPCDRIDITDDILRKRLQKIELTVTLQKQNLSAKSKSRSNRMSLGSPSNFPLLEPQKFFPKSRNHNPALIKQGDRYSKSIDPSVISKPKISLLSNAPADIAKNNWAFVEELLKECKNKTKRILLEKIGSEAVEWGHGDITFLGSEENMLVASLCDLIERIWSHGLQTRSGKSSLWHFLYKYGRANEKVMKFKGTLGAQAFCSPFIRSKPYILVADNLKYVPTVSVLPRRNSQQFDPAVMAAVHNVSTIREIKTEIGYARAWIRIALERKCLAQFLKVLTSDSVILKNLYKRYAFLRCEEERQQALHHIETLSTVEFSCFTNAYAKSNILYQVLIFPAPNKSNVSCTANVWVHVIGSFGESGILKIPKGIIHFAFWCKNLGVITSLRLGLDNSGSNPNWLVQHVLIRNEFTGTMYKFACGRWLGQSMDDGSTERYMVGCHVPMGVNQVELLQGCAHPPLQTLPPTAIRSVDPDNEMSFLQTMLGDAINRIVKFHLKSLNEKISYAHLMCGENGLVHALLNIFSFGFKSARLFGKNLFVWDFFLKVTSDFNQSLPNLRSGPNSIANQHPSNSPMNSPMRMAPGNSNTLDSPKRISSLSNLLDSPRRIPGTGSTPQGTLSRSNQFRRMYTKLISRIESICSNLGKDDKFQLFVCLAAHDRLLGRIITDLTRSVAAQHLYEEASFMRQPNLISFLSHILEAIQDISIPVDPAMTKCLELR